MASSARREFLHLVLSNRLLVTGGVIVLAFLLTAAFAPLLAPYTFKDISASGSLLPAGTPGHLLGTDALGRDLLSRIIYGARISLKVSVLMTAISLVGGVLVGSVSGYFRGKTDLTLSAVVDFVWGFPIVLVAVIIVGIMGPGLVPTMIAVGLINWAGFARIVRGEVLSLRERDFITAARALGHSDGYIIWHHIIPNVIPPTLVMASFYMAIAITVEAALSFIGLGAQPPDPSWGQLVADGRNYLLRNPGVAAYPGAALALVVLGFNLLGDGLRDVLDPKLRQ